MTGLAVRAQAQQATAREKEACSHPHQRVHVALECVGVERLREQVSVVGGGLLPLDDDVPFGDPLANLEEAALDVARPLRALFALGELDCARVRRIAPCT